MNRRATALEPVGFRLAARLLGRQPPDGLFDPFAEAPTTGAAGQR